MRDLQTIGGYDFVLLVFAGQLPDVCFGRYKVMKVSIWVMWWGSVCTDILGGRHPFMYVNQSMEDPLPCTEQVEDVKTFFRLL